MMNLVKLAWCLFILLACLSCVPKNTSQPMNIEDSVSVQQNLDLKVYTLELISAPKTVRFFGDGCKLLAGSPTHVSILDFNESRSVEFPRDNTAYDFSAKSNTLALGQSGGFLLIYDTATGKLRESLKGGATPQKIEMSLEGDPKSVKKLH